MAPLNINKAFEKADLNLLWALFMKSINGKTGTPTVSSEAPINHDYRHQIVT